VDKLAPVAYNVLSFLINFLVKVADHSATNKMTASNLGVVFGPNIIWDDNDNDINNSLKGNNDFTKELTESLTNIRSSELNHRENDSSLQRCFPYPNEGHQRSPRGKRRCVAYLIKS